MSKSNYISSILLAGVLLGCQDEVPYQNSEKTLAAFNTAGSTDVTLSLIPGGSH